MSLAAAARRPALRCMNLFVCVPLLPLPSEGKKRNFNVGCKIGRIRQSTRAKRGKSLLPEPPFGRSSSCASPHHEVSLTPGTSPGSEGNGIESMGERSGVRRAAAAIGMTRAGKAACCGKETTRPRRDDWSRGAGQSAAGGRRHRPDPVHRYTCVASAPADSFDLLLQYSGRIRNRRDRAAGTPA
jgi:hypothetical protein